MDNLVSPSSEHRSTSIKLNFAFQGSSLDLLLLIVKNVILTILTLGLYYPWGKTAMRKFLWQHTKLGKHNFEYLGTGKELFFGYLKIVGLYLFVSISFAFAGNNPVVATIMGLTILFFALIIVPLAMWGVHSYRTTRTRYRNIHFTIDHRQRNDFIKGAIGRFALSFVTLYLYFPFFLNYVYKSLIESTSFGNLRFKYTSTGMDYFKVVIKSLLLTIITLGLYAPWALVAIAKHRLTHIELDGAKIFTDLRGSDVLIVALMQIILVPLTLGLAFPYVQVFALRMFFNNMTLEGSLDFAAIQAAAQQRGDVIGDTMADFFNIDVL